MELDYNSEKFPVQVLELEGSFFIYIGQGSFDFENLIVAFSSSNNVFSSNIYNNVESDSGKRLSERFCKKFNCPFYVSFNISDEKLNKSIELSFYLEVSISNFITTLISNNSN